MIWILVVLIHSLEVFIVPLPMNLNTYWSLHILILSSFHIHRRDIKLGKRSGPSSEESDSSHSLSSIRNNSSSTLLAHSIVSNGGSIRIPDNSNSGKLIVISIGFKIYFLIRTCLFLLLCKFWLMACIVIVM